MREFAHRPADTTESVPGRPFGDFVELAGQARRTDQVLPERAKTLSAVPLDAAYGLQGALGAWFERHGHGPRVGYKIGATASAMQRYLGVEHPVYGRVHEADVHDSGALLPRSSGAPVAVECELAVRLASDLPARDAPWRRDELNDYVGAIAPAIEIVENRYGDFESTALGTLIADDMFHKCAVVGAWQAYDHALDLAGMRARLSLNDEHAESGTGAEILGHPLEAVAWLATALGPQGEGLRAGDVVLTGSMTAPVWLEALPARIATDLSGVGRCECTLIDRERRS